MKEQETEREKRISGTGWSSEYLWANTWNRCQFVNLRQAFWKDLETRQQQCHIRVRQAKRSWSLLLLLFFKDWCDFQWRWSLSCSFSYMSQGRGEGGRGNFEERSWSLILLLFSKIDVISSEDDHYMNRGNGKWKIGRGGKGNYDVKSWTLLHLLFLKKWCDSQLRWS